MKMSADFLSGCGEPDPSINPPLSQFLSFHFDKVWELWKHAVGSEARELRGVAVARVKDCLQRGGVFLRFHNLNLSNIPSRLPSTVESLDLSDNQLSSLPVLPRLKALNISGNPLTELPELPVTLEKLYADRMQLKKLPWLPPNLKVLSVCDNQLDQLPGVLPNGLKELYVNRNFLTQLPCSLPATLERLTADANIINELPQPLPAAMKLLSVKKNYLTELPPHLPPKLEELYVNNNCLYRMDYPLAKCLTFLDIGCNQLKKLAEPLPEQLKYLCANHNALTQLPKKLPKLLRFLHVGNNQIENIPDYSYLKATIDVGGNPLSKPSIIQLLRMNSIPGGPRVLMELAQELKVRGKPHSLSEAVLLWGMVSSIEQEAWESIQQETDAHHFATFLVKLRLQPTHDTAEYKAQIAKWLSALIGDEQQPLREALFQIVGQSCYQHEEIIFYLYNQMQMLTLTYGIDTREPCEISKRIQRWQQVISSMAWCLRK